MGVKLNAQQRKNEEYCHAVDNILDLCFEFAKSPWLWIKPIRYLSGRKAEMMKNIAIAKKLTNKVLEDRMRQLEEECNSSKFEEKKNEECKISYKGKPKMSFIDLLISLYKKGELTLEQVKDELQTFVLAGHDSTALSTGFVLFALGHRPKIQEKVFDELQSVFGDSDRGITYEDTKRLTYLGQCIKETIRMWPTVMFFGRRLTKDTDICGYTIPADTTVCISSITCHHDPEQFPLPEEFDPDHFSPENVAKRDPFAFIPFSGGVRNCIGQRFAVTEEKVVIASILRRFRIVSMMSEQENRCIPEISSKPIHGFPVRLFRR